MTVRDVTAALGLLERLGAPHRLVRHHALVAEAAQQILDDLGDLARGVDRELVLVGAALHDAGKILLADGVFERVAGGADDRLARSLSRPSQ